MKTLRAFMALTWREKLVVIAAFLFTYYLYTQMLLEAVR